jgi:hypothetical protein
LASISTLASAGISASGIFTRSPTSMPLPVMASYLSLLMLTSRWILRMPSQCSTSGISSWKRMSCTPATHSVRRKYLSALSPPTWRLRAL